MLSKILTIASYALGALVVVGGTFILIAYGNGYTYDFKTGRLVHRGLLIVNSTPSGSKVTLNDKRMSSKTPFRKTLEAGYYNVILQHDDYIEWHKRLKVVPTLASLHQYVILIPKKLTSEKLVTHEALGQTLPSEDHHRLAYIVPTGIKNGVWSLNIDNGQERQIYAPASATDSQPAESVELVQWSDDDSHVLIHTKIGDTAGYIIIAANGNDDPIPVTSTFNVNPTNLVFNPSNWRQLYWNSENGLVRLDVGEKTVSSPLAEHVGAFTFADGRILYIRNDTSPVSLWALENNGQNHQLVKALPPSTNYEVSYSTYQRISKVAVVAQDSRQTTLYSDIFNQPVVTTLPATGTHAKFNGDGRFLLQYDETHTATYDLQETTSYTFPAGEAITNLSWFDTYHLVYTAEGKVFLSEFDGNYANAMGTTTNAAPFNAPNDRSVIVVAPTSAGPVQIKSVIIRP